MFFFALVMHQENPQHDSTKQRHSELSVTTRNFKIQLAIKLCLERVWAECLGEMGILKAA